MKRFFPKMLSAAIMAVMIITACTFAEEIPYDTLSEIEIIDELQEEGPESDGSLDVTTGEEIIPEETDCETIDNEIFDLGEIYPEEIYLEETFTDLPVSEILLDSEPEEIDLNEYEYLYTDEIQESLLAGGNLEHKRDLCNGINGADVSSLQIRLTELGYSVGTIDGQFGSITEAAVRKFQKDHNLTVDGIVGSITIKALNTVNSGNTQTSTSSSSYSGRYLTIGMSGSDVITLQKRLTELGYSVGEIDGIFGSMTKAAVLRFQKDKGLYQDGEVGSITLNALNMLNTASTQTSAVSVAFNRYLTVGMNGSDVTALQTRLTELGYTVGAIDGDFGSMTKAAVIKFQKDKGLYQDGEVGSITLKALFPNGISVSSSSVSSTASIPGKLTLTRTLLNGLNGADVLELQNCLEALGYDTGGADGIFGSYTEAAVRAFQKDNNLYVDGVVGNITITALNNYISSLQQNLTTANNSDLKRGMIGEKVVILQNKLKALGYYSGTSNGNFDASTESALKSFQKNNGMTIPTGVLDDWTQNKLEGNPVNRYGNTYSIELKTTTGTAYMLRTLSYESEGEDVKSIQQKLSDLGYLIAVPKGYFGNLTYDAVVAFQKDHGMKNPTGTADKWTLEKLAASTAKETKTVPEYTFSELTTSVIITDKNYDRNDYEIKYIIPHHMAGKLSGAGCANYFVNNGLENSANYCIGYDGDIAAGVPEDYGAWTSSWWFADEQGITIEVSDESNSTDYIPDKAIESLIYLCVDLIQRYPSLGGQMIYDPSDAEIVTTARNVRDGSMLSNIKGNILLHNWTSGGKTSCPGQDMIDKLPLVTQKVNELLANPNLKLDLSEFTQMTEEKKQKEEEERLKAEQEESEEG